MILRFDLHNHQDIGHNLSRPLFHSVDTQNNLDIAVNIDSKRRTVTNFGNIGNKHLENTLLENLD